MLMTTSTVLSQDELEKGGSCSSAFGYQPTADSFGTLRRSLRQINTFKNRLFRLPATPRLSRSKKVLVGRGEEVTGWNFERGIGSTNSAQQNHFPATPFHQTNQKAYLSSLTAAHQRAPIATVDETDFHSARFSFASSSMCNNSLPEGFVGGGSCRLNNASGNTYFKRKKRPEIPSFDPPDANQARNTIHEHLRTLLPSPTPILNNDQIALAKCTSSSNDRNQQFIFLPNTSYSANGEMYSASWQTDEAHEKGNRLNSPTQSTISLLNTQSNRGKIRSLSSSSASMQKRQSRPSYQLNGLFHQPSLKSICTVPNHAASRTSILMRSNEQLSFVEMKTPPPILFSFTESHKEGQNDYSFLGREWLFKELYQTAVVEKAPVTLIQGANGSGKSAVVNQLVLNSPFFMQKGTNADTVDSGIVVGSTGSQTSLNSSTNFSSRNYEWLRIVASRVVAFHTCHLYCAATCSIPEFVRNISSYMCTSPLLRPYTERICGDERLYQLATSETASLEVDPVELFRLLVLQPLDQLNINQLKLDSCNLSANDSQLNGDDAADTACLIVLIDGVDEAGFHRNDGDESIGWLLKQTAAEFPSWLRFIVTSSTVQPFYGLDLRTIRLDDAELDERVLRDSRLFIDYHFTINPAFEDRVRERRCSFSNPEDVLMEFVEEMLKRSKGNHLFLSLLFKMIEQDRVRLKATSLSLLPTELQQLYLLHFNLNFTSLSLFHMVSPILSVILASLKPMRFKELLRVLNAGQTETRVCEKELNKRLSLLSPMIVKLSSGVYVPLHQSFREWLLKESSETDYFVDVRYGHILLSLSLVRQGNLQSEQLFELGHHLLKANPHKYLQEGVAPDMPTDKGAQISWIKVAAGENVTEALLYSRNTFYPNSKVTRLLLLAGASPNCIFTNGESLLCSFARSGNYDMLQLLLQYGADIEYANPFTGETPLIVAVKHKHFESARLLHTSGARLDVADKKGDSVLVHAAQVDALPLLSFLLEAGNWGQGNPQKNTRKQFINEAFEAAARMGKVRICRYLLDCVDATLDTCSAMCIACASGQSEVVQFLLSRGATLSPSKSWNGKSALICAVESGSWDLVVNVLNAALVDLNINHSSSNELTPLMVAARNGHVGLVDLLINRGAALDVQDDNGRTAIMYAIEHKHTSTAALLIDRGCDILVKDMNKNTLIHLLAKHPNKCLINRLLKLGLSLEEKNCEELRAIEVAIKHNSQLAIDAFLASGARLRSLTWQIALDSNPELLLVLTKKLLDDASILLRRKRPHEALHRFNYALQKCSELLKKCEQEGKEEDGEQEAVVKRSVSKEELAKKGVQLHPPLSSIQSNLRQFKLQSLFSIAYLKRRNNELSDALELANEVFFLINSEDDDTRFELYMFRAKCFFDSRNVASARQDAQMALMLKPDNVDVQNLIAILNTPLVHPAFLE